MTNIPKLPIREMFLEHCRRLGLPEDREEEIWEEFLAWYERGLRKHWDKKFRNFFEKRSQS